MVTKEQLIKFSTYPFRALTSRKFYFEVLFSMKGLGFLYLLALCFILAIPSTLKINSVLNTFRDIELPRLIASIPPSYLTQDGVFVATNPEDGYKELRTTKGTLAVVYNVNDEALKTTETPIVELTSRQIIVRGPQKETVLNYSELVAPGISFNPLEVSNLTEAVFDVAATMLLVFLTGWFFCVLVFNAFITAILSKFLFLFVGKMKTSFTNTLRLSSFANTIVGLLLLVELILNIRISSFSLIMLTPLIYMLVFIRSFRSELENKGLNDFVKNYTTEGTKVKKYDEDGNTVEPRRDVSDFTDGLNSTSNKNNEELSEKDDEPVSNNQDDIVDENDKSSDTINTKQKSNKKDNDSNDDGPGIFTP